MAKVQQRIDRVHDTNPKPVEAYMMTSKLKRLVRNNREIMLQQIAEKRSTLIKTMDDVMFRLDLLTPEITKVAYTEAMVDFSKLSKFIFKTYANES